MEQTTVLACAQCGQTLHPDVLACPNCGALVYRARLEQLSAEALHYEQTDPATAMRIWRQCLDLLPLESRQYQLVYERMRLLAGGTIPQPPYSVPGGDGPTVLPYESPRRRPSSDTWSTALLKTGGSMLLSIAAYALLMQSLPFAAGFVLLILVHEMGHVIAMRYYRLSASAPIFIPFMGALINLRQAPPNAKVEAIVGIGGPITGTIGALACYLLFLFVYPHWMLLALAYFGFMLNLFNMLPVPPLDGGRVTAAVSPWIWMLGIVGLIALMLFQFSVILLLILMFAWPRIWATLKGRARQGAYYQISRQASVTIGAIYLTLGIALLVLFLLARHQMRLYHIY